MERIFITGIDTDIGKTFTTGNLAKQYIKEGKKVITFKLVQTGCQGISEDILKHREIMNSPILDIDTNGTTCPYVFSFPCSPHLAAELENKTIDVSVIDNALQSIENSGKYDICLIEGAGGIMVPITKEFYILDYIKTRSLPVVLVTHTGLGSINHTLLTLAMLQKENILIKDVIFNDFFKSNTTIDPDSKKLITEWLRKNRS